MAALARGAPAGAAQATGGQPSDVAAPSVPARAARDAGDAPASLGAPGDDRDAHGALSRQLWPSALIDPPMYLAPESPLDGHAAIAPCPEVAVKQVGVLGGKQGRQVGRPEVSVAGRRARVCRGGRRGRMVALAGSF